MIQHGKQYGAIVLVFVGLAALALPGGGQAQQQEITGKDGAPMVLVPAGEFTMGGNEAAEEKPVHQVSLDAYYMDKYEVTVEQYAKFLEATSHGAPPEWKILNQPSHQKYPVVMVDWSDANTYCHWAEKRLPTEAEWEKAARGTDGRMYPWGNDVPTPLRANYGKKKWNKDTALVPVGSFEEGKSPYGIYDMAGNAWEWVSDWYYKVYYKNSPSQNPTGPKQGDFKALRGGSWHSRPESLHSANRNYGPPAHHPLHYNGFRCAKTP
jgi:formylglycine-generating enzyme required for sulfatase activity